MDGVNRQRTKVSGKTRVNPETPAKKDGRSIARKLARLDKRVKKLCRRGDAPPMAFIYVDRGLIKIAGTPQLCEAIGGVRGKELEAVVNPVITAKAKESFGGPKTTISLKGVDPLIDWESVNMHQLRQAYSQVCTEKGDTAMNRYLPEKRPSYWPKEVPFCSHSKENEGGGRMHNSISLQKVLKAFCEYCLKKIADGYIPQDIPKSTSLELLQQIASRKNDDNNVLGPNLSSMEVHDIENECRSNNVMLEQTNMETECPSSEVSIGQTDMEVHDMETNCPSNENDITSLKEDIIQGKIDDDKISVLSGEKVTFLSQPPKRIRNYTGPEHLCPGGEATNVWHLLHSKPDLAQIVVWNFARSHIKHYVDQYKNVNIHEVKKALEYTGQATTCSAIFEEEIGHILTDELPNKARWLFIAGALGQEVAVYYEKRGSYIYPPCPCHDEDPSQVQFYVDAKMRIYPLSNVELWRASSVHTRKRVEVAVPCSNEEWNFATLPGMQDGRLFTCYGYEVWKGEVERVKQGHWLDDTIVNVLLRNEKENHPDVELLDSTFARKYLVPRNTADTGCKLPLTASNLEDVTLYHRRLKLDGLRLIVVPVCDNIHWFLAAFSPFRRILYIMCSLGRKPKRAADSLKRFFEYIYSGKEIKIEYPNVPRQENGDDCGVFVIEFGLYLMKTSEPNWSTMEKGKRNKIVKLIEMLY